LLLCNLLLNKQCLEVSCYWHAQEFEDSVGAASIQVGKRTCQRALADHQQIMKAFMMNLHATLWRSVIKPEKYVDTLRG